MVVQFNNCTITSTNFIGYKILKYIFIYQFIALHVSHTQGKMTIRDKKIITFNTAERWWKTNHHLVHLPWQTFFFCKVKISKCITVYYKLKFEDFYNPFCKHIFIYFNKKYFRSTSKYTLICKPRQLSLYKYFLLFITISHIKANMDSISKQQKKNNMYTKHFRRLSAVKKGQLLQIVKKKSLCIFLSPFPSRQWHLFIMLKNLAVSFVDVLNTISKIMFETGFRYILVIR